MYLNTETTTPIGVPRSARGVHQRRAKKPKKRASPRPRGDQTHPIGATSNRSIPRGDRPKQRHRGLNNRLELLRSHPVDDRPRAAEAER